MLKKQKGFTILELLVVLVIIGVLAGLAIAGIRIVQQINRDTQRKAFAKDIATLMQAYESDHYDFDTTLTFSPDDPECSTGEMRIETEDDNNYLCTKVNFDPVNLPDDCTGYINGTIEEQEENSGQINGCFHGEGKSYYLYLLLERSDKPYNASNAE